MNFRKARSFAMDILTLLAIVAMFAIVIAELAHL